MDYLRTALVVSLGLVGFAAHAGYAQLTPPAGFTQNGSSYLYRAAANAGSIVQNTVRTNAALNVGGRSILVPAAMRFAANAPTIAARFVYVNPALAIGVGVGALALAAWLKSSDIEWDQEKKAWVTPGEGTPSTGMRFSVGTAQVNNAEATGYKFTTVKDACAYSAGTFNSAQPQNGPFTVFRCDNFGVGMTDKWGNEHYRSVNYTGDSCPVGWYVTDAGCVQTPPPRVVPEPEFVEKMAPKTLPDAVPEHLPIDLPVEQPKINPTPFPDGSPTPFRVPQGEPRLVPDSNPQQWKTPAIEVTPAPTPDQPLRIDMTPVDVIKPTPEPIKPLDPIKQDDPAKTQEKTPDLCEKNPDIVACQKLGTIDAKPLAQSSVPLSIKKDEGFGPANGTCPAARSLTLMGRTYSFSWQPMCDFASAIRPLLIGFAYLTAAMSFMGMARKES